jgi:hypothetical protein
MHAYDTVSQAVNGLKGRGYNLDFNLEGGCLTCQVNDLSLEPSEFEITEVHRFEGMSDPGDEAVVYAIESKHGDKGVFVGGYGVSAEDAGTEMVEKLKIHH